MPTDPRKPDRAVEEDKPDFPLWYFCDTLDPFVSFDPNEDRGEFIS